MANDALIPVAQSHYDRSKELTARILASNSTADLTDSDLPVFYANVDMARCGDVFKELKFNSAPYMILAPPRFGTTTQKSNAFLGSLAPRYRFNLQASMAPSDFNNFVNKLVGPGVRVELDTPKPGFVDLIVTLVVLCVLGFLTVKYGWDILSKVREMRGIRSLALMVGLGL